MKGRQYGEQASPARSTERFSLSGWLFLISLRSFQVSRFEELLRVMAVLRGQGGCPWDRQQTHQTLKGYLLEEAYEVLEAIDRGDDRALKE